MDGKNRLAESKFGVSDFDVKLLLCINFSYEMLNVKSFSSLFIRVHIRDGIRKCI